MNKQFILNYITQIIVLHLSVNPVIGGQHVLPSEPQPPDLDMLPHKKSCL